jgi:hypothetical protein
MELPLDVAFIERGVLLVLQSTQIDLRGYSCCAKWRLFSPHPIVIGCSPQHGAHDREYISVRACAGMQILDISGLIVQVLWNRFSNVLFVLWSWRIEHFPYHTNERESFQVLVLSKNDLPQYAAGSRPLMSRLVRSNYQSQN